MPKAKFSLGPGLALKCAVLALLAVVAGIAFITMLSVQRSRADLNLVENSVLTSDAYWAALNAAVKASLEATRLELDDDARPSSAFVPSLLAAFEASERIKTHGTDVDRGILSDLEQNYAVSIQEVLAYLANPGESGVPQLPARQAATMMDDVTLALAGPASERRAEALDNLQSLQRSNENRSVVILGALVVGLPFILAIFWAIRHYDRRSLIHDGQVKRLEEAAYTDNLTALGNHRAFQEELRREWHRTVRDDSVLTLALMDIDDFKVVNDSKGHAYGDKVLSDFARLFPLVLDAGRAFRLGGDEFAIIIPCRDKDTTRRELVRLLDLTRAALDGVAVSIGICSSLEVDDAEALQEKADVALYEAKRRGKDQILIYTEELDHERESALARVAELRRVLDSRSLNVAFQPIYDFEDGSMIACEALARLPDSFLSGPSEAFATADIAGNSWELDRCCIAAAVDLAHDMPSGLRLFLNLDPRSFTSPEFSAEFIKAEAVAAGLDPGRIVIEVTERGIVPAPILKRCLGSLREQGFGVALDDVGSGNAGLEMLRSYDFDFIKVDRAVIRSAALQETHGRAVLLAILAFAAETGSRVIAEGVETRESLAMLRYLGQLPSFRVAGLQGFLLSPPLESMGQLREHLVRVA